MSIHTETPHSFPLNAQPSLESPPETNNLILPNLLFGIPSHHRPDLWRKLTNSFDLDEEGKLTFLYLKSQYNKELEDIIRIDIHRTFTNSSEIGDRLEYYKGGLFEILKAYGNLDTEVGYCQGMGFIVGVFLQSLPTFEEAFYCFVHIMVKFEWRKMFLCGTPKVFRVIDSFKRLLETQMVDVYTHLEEENFNLTGLVGHFMTIFSYKVPLEFSIQVMDLFLIKGEEFLLNLMIRMIELKKEKILELKEEFLYEYMQEEIVLDCWREYGRDVVLVPLSGEEEDNFILL